MRFFFIFIFFLSGCESSTITVSSSTTLTQKQGFLVNSNSQKLKHKHLPININIDTDSLPDSLVNGCKSAVISINKALGRTLLAYSVDEESNTSVLLQGNPVSNKTTTHAQSEIEFDDRFITHVTVSFDTSSQFSNSPIDQEYDAISVCLHEIGHSVGLAHSDSTGSVMSEHLMPKEIRRKLSELDLSRLEKLYF